MTNQLLSIIILLTLVFIEFFSDIIIKKWALNQINILWLIPTFFIFVTAFFLWVMAMKVQTFSRVVNYYALLSVVGGSLLGYLFFHEKMSAVNISGVILALISILLISI